MDSDEFLSGVRVKAHGLGLVGSQTGPKPSKKEVPENLSPHDTTLLSDIVEVGSLPSFLQGDQKTRYAFYILTHHGLRFECSSISKIQVDSWLRALRTDCKFESDGAAPDASLKFISEVELGDDPLRPQGDPEAKLLQRHVRARLRQGARRNAQVERRPHGSAVAVVTINRSGALNSLTRPMMVALAGAFRRLDADAGHGRAFCSSVDLTTAEDVFKGDIKDPAADPVAAMAACRKPIVGAIAGLAVTAGFEIALACDLLVSGGDAKLVDTSPTSALPKPPDPHRSCAAGAARSSPTPVPPKPPAPSLSASSPSPASRASSPAPAEPSSGSRSVASCPGSPSPTSSSPAMSASTATSPASSTPSSAPRRRATRARSTRS
ncbi:putative enoyl-CoA hydratase echA8 [Ananas comosus]|uniref:Putative enoyl-CoA hydratase echA8 n=1 Tax=Ananas comosus TaxID=4615 RepID=A0A199VD12_ANACO|nr:putative enoyl-CoA hydratase echA8 [Ananas comosus]